MQELILLKSGEIALKGLNRASFEDVLIRNAKRAVAPFGEFRFYKAQSTLYAQPKDGAVCDLDQAVERLSKVFGIAALTRACIVDKEYEAIRQAAVDYLGESLQNAETFKVNAKRADKKFPMDSPEICRELGGFLLDRFSHLRVDVHAPQITVTVEIRDFAAYIHAGQRPGAGGIPVGCGGRAALLLSGGIDSPVAAYRMARRGLELMAVHFAAPPYTSERAQKKVELLCEKLAPWCGRMRLYTVPFTEIQERIRERCPEDLFTLVMRRYMMRIAQSLADSNDCGALVTGESLGQVASQTMAAIATTDAVTSLPVLRPLIGMDKEEIIALAKRIDTFETSILPYEDCCTVFVPRHPKTKPKLAELTAAEECMDADALCERAVAQTVWRRI